MNEQNDIYTPDWLMEELKMDCYDRAAITERGGLVYQFADYPVWSVLNSVGDAIREQIDFKYNFDHYEKNKRNNNS